MLTSIWPDGVYRSRWLLPVSGPPVHNSEIRVVGGKVAEIRRYSGVSPAVDLGDGTIIPALVNAHTHLEFSDLRQPIGTRGMSLPAWVGQVVARRATNANDGANDGANKGLMVELAIASGIRESAEAGVALIAEISTIPPLISSPGISPEISSRPLAPVLHRFAEVLGLSEQRAQACLDWAGTVLDSSADTGLSPHAPYSVPPALLERCLELAKRRRRTVQMHLAESAEELELLETGSGEFRASLERIGVWRDGLFPVSGGIDFYLQRLLTASRVMLVHGNYLREPQMDLIAGNAEISVVYCPRTHAFFQHPPHPVADLVARGIRVALGTDSRASNPDLSIWNEARFLRAHRADLSPGLILKMITLAGAEALGRDDYGRIEIGQPARLLFVPQSISSDHAEQLFESLFEENPLTPSELFKRLTPG